MPLISKPNYNQIFASQAPEQDKPAVFNNYPGGWGVESRPNNGKPTIKGFNYLQQISDLKDLWILQNGACLPYDESIEYAEGAPVLKDGVIQYKTAGGFKSRDAVTIPTYSNAADGVDPVTGVANGAYFNVRSTDDATMLVEYQNGGGSAVATGKSYPSASYINGLAEYIALPFKSGKSYALHERVQLAGGAIVKSTISGNTTDPNTSMVGWKLDNQLYAYSIAQVESLNAPIGSTVTLINGFRSGEFTIFPSSDTVALDVIRPTATTVSLSEAALADTFRGIYIQTQNGVAVRVVESDINAGWFGVSYDWDDTTQSGTDDSLRLEAAMHYALSQQLKLITENGAIRTTKQLNSQKDENWKSLNWHSNETRIIVDHAGSGMRFSGGARKITQTGILTFEKPNAFKTAGGNTFPPTTTLVDFLATKNAGVIFDGNRHSITDIRTKGFNVGVLLYAGSNMNYSDHNLDARENDVGVLMFGPGNDLSVIRSEIYAYANYQEGIYVADGTNFRQWDGRFRAENNLLDRVTDPAIAGRYAVYIGNHIACNLWCYVEQYAGTTPGTLELYISDTGSSEIFSARRNADYLRGNNQGKTGNTIYQNFFTNPPAVRESVPLRIEGRGVRISNANDFIDLPIRTTDGDYGGLRGQAGRIKLRSATSAQEVSLSDSDVRLGKSFNTVVVDAVTLLRASPTATKTIKTLSASNEAVLGTLHVVGGAFRSSHGYAPYILKLDFYINNGVIVLDEAGKFYNNPSEGNSSAALRLVGNVLYLDLAYTPAWWGDDYKFKYKVELLTGTS